MTARAGLVIAIRALAAIAIVVFAVLAFQRSTADVTFTFPSSETSGLATDVVYRCGSAPTSFDVSAGAVALEGDVAYQDWALGQAKETGQPPDTQQLELAACEAARDARVISLVWLIAGALASGIILVGAVLAPTRPR